MLAVQVMLGVVRDARIRAERMRKLDAHFRQAQEDVAGALASARSESLFARAAE